MMSDDAIETDRSSLPIFRLRRGERCLLYAPGHLVVGTPALADRIEAALAGDPSSGPEAEEAAAHLRRCAEQAVEIWQKALESPFSPECLTVYLSNRCQSACSYCFAAVERGGVDALSVGGSGRAVGSETQPTGRRVGSETQPTEVDCIRDDVVLAAARVVARACAAEGQPFRLVLHGGGEPTLHWPLVERLHALTREVAAAAGIGWWGYVATSGVLAPEKVLWLAEHFDQIGLSCDGPPEIQDLQRPLLSGQPTSAAVYRTAEILARHARRWTVRTTITPQTVRRQTEIIRYLGAELHAPEVRFEPVYTVAASADRACYPAFSAADAPVFVEHFLAAQDEAEAMGCSLTFSGVRLDEIHGPYCDMLRRVLHLTPDGRATACFFAVDGSSPPGANYAVGAWDQASGQFLLDRARLDVLRRRAMRILDRCRQCVNLYHCIRECPDVCRSREVVEDAERAEGFRCAVARQLTQAWLFRAADSLAASATRDEQRPPSSTHRRALPPPVWARRGYDDNGPRAWQRICRRLERADGQAISAYVHVPLCDRHCPFCDCHRLTLDRRREREETYVRALLHEINLWTSTGRLAGRPVTTVHFGGGTPNCLTPARFAAIVERLRSGLAVTPSTEWALEITSSLLGQQSLGHLSSLGFTRLHVGVQTLEDPVRRLLARREPADRVVQKIEQALGQGFIVSVDVMYGLPRQTRAGLAATLERLVAAGVHGFSLYQLQRSARNRRFFERHPSVGTDARNDFALFEAAAQFLESRGYRKNHFTHYARPEDENLYYTHALRGEDLLALGATADGVFRGYRYRHPQYEAYVAGEGHVVPTLEGGVEETPLEQRLQPAAAMLMAGRISQARMESLDVGDLLDCWLASGWIEDTDSVGWVSDPTCLPVGWVSDPTCLPVGWVSDPTGIQESGSGQRPNLREDRPNLRLTASGSWHLAAMLDELAEEVRRRQGFSEGIHCGRLDSG